MDTNITVVNTICSGAPTVKGTRLTVFNIISKIYYEDSLNEAIEEYGITISIAKEAIHYCSNMICQTDSRLIKFCSGCLLRTLQDSWEFNKKNYNEIKYDNSSDVITISKDGNQFFLGTIEELENNDFGKIGWMLASEDKIKYPILNP